MSRYGVIAELEPDPDHMAVHEALENVNAELGGEFTILSEYKSGQGTNCRYLLVEEVEES